MLYLEDDNGYEDKTVLDYLEEAGYGNLLAYEGDRYAKYVDDVTEQNLFPFSFEGEEIDDEGTRADSSILPWWTGGDEGEFYTSKADREGLQEEYESRHRDAMHRAKELFGKTEMEDDEFLRQKPWDLIGLTAHQFHMIDPDRFTDATFPIFRQALMSDIARNALPAIEDRIRYAELCAATIGTDLDCVDEKDVLYISRIAKKKDVNEAIRLVQLYADYMNMRQGAVNYNRYVIPEKDDPEHPAYDYPLYPKLGAIEDLHDKAMRDSRAYQKIVEDDKREHIDEGIGLTASTPQYRKLLYSDRTYAVYPVHSLDELEKEGEDQDNCVGEYGKEFAEGNSLIYVLRKKAEPDKAFYTAEISYVGMAPILKQLYTYANGTEKEPDFLRFVKRWCRARKIYIRCDL